MNCLSFFSHIPVPTIHGFSSLQIPNDASNTSCRSPCRRTRLHMAKGRYTLTFYLSTDHLLHISPSPFNGNGLPFDMAEQLVRACNVRASNATILRIRLHYDEWTDNPDDDRLGIYWNVRLHDHVWLNGSYRRLYERVDPDVIDHSPQLLFGFRPSTWACRLMLAHLRRTLLYIPLH
jgi:hypothetical protein